MGKHSTYEWRYPEKGLDILLAPAALDKMQRDFEDRGSSAQGVLIGSLQQAGAESVCIVNACHPLDRSPDGLLEQAEAVRTMVNGWKQTPALLRPVGVYMGTPADLDNFCAKQLPVLIAPFDAAMAVVIHGRLDGNVVKGEVLAAKLDGSPVLRTPFSTGETTPVSPPPRRSIVDEPRPEPPPRPRPVAVGAAAAQPVPIRPPEFAPPPIAAEPVGPRLAYPQSRVEPPGPPLAAPPIAAMPMQTAPMGSPYIPPPVARNRMPWILSGASVAVLLIGAAGAWWKLRPGAATATQTVEVAPLASSSGLDLRVSRQGGDLEITWNRNAPAVQNAEVGFLYITDGGQRTEVYLEDSHLRTGRAMYSPRTSDIDIRLELVTPDRKSFKEALKIIQSGNERSSASRMAARSEPAPLRITPGNSRPATPGAATSEPATQETTDAQQEPARKVFLAPASATEQASAPAGTVRIESTAPPEIKLAQIAPHPAAVPSQLSINPPAPREEAAEPQMEPPAATATRRNVDRPVPVPLRQYPATLPTQLRQMLVEDLVIPVHLTIDAQGKVVAAKVDPQDTPVKTRLASIAVESARRWTFQPATRDGRNVPSAYTLMFRFHR